MIPAVVLQIGLPGAAELGILLLVILLLAAVVGRWVYNDAKRRGSDWAWQWAVGIVLLFLLGIVPGLFGVIVYLLVRTDQIETAM